jgi:hypothetical protein
MQHRVQLLEVKDSPKAVATLPRQQAVEKQHVVYLHLLSCLLAAAGVSSL